MGTISLLQKPDIILDDGIFEPTITATWVGFVKSGEANAQCTLSEDIESFLVFTLMRFAKRTDLFSMVLAVKFLTASTEYVNRRKEEALSEIGDASLILAGLFPERSRKMGLSSTYFEGLGRMAFTELADSYAMRRLRGLEGLYRDVEQSFPVMANVLAATRGRRTNCDALNLPV